MTKKLKLFSTLRDIAGAREIEVPFEDGQTVRDLVESIRLVNPALAEYMVNENGEMTGLVHVLVHGRHIQWLEGLATPIKERDLIVLIPPSAGG